MLPPNPSTRPQVLRLLSRAPNPCAILEAQPDLVDPVSLSRCLASLAQVGAGWALAQGAGVQQGGNTGNRRCAHVSKDGC